MTTTVSRRATAPLFGIDPTKQAADFATLGPLLHVLTSLLTQVLDADLVLTAAERTLERAELRAETDALTGLLNRRGWDGSRRSEGD